MCIPLVELVAKREHTKCLSVELGIVQYLHGVGGVWGACRLDNGEVQRVLPCLLCM